MSEADVTSSFDYTDVPFPQPAKLSRRMRPPDLEIKTNMDNRAPLRSDKHAKSGKRESRLAFGRLFGRHRVVTETEATRAARDAHDSKDADVTSDTSGSRYDLQSQGAKSETHLAPIRVVDTASGPKTAGMKSPVFAPLPLPSSPALAPANGKRRGSLAATVWDPAPLFQAWPQAVRTATLPACLQADHLLRLHNKKEMLPAINHPDLGDEMDVFVTMAKKRHRRTSSSFKLDWTTKVYILITSGYLLQYPGDGPHDCLPEKVVQLTKDSAAFASDVIPGKHWVLQVSSVFEDGALTSHDTRSLLGKFGLREKERRQASDMLMIFDNAADMESWMSLLRREIEVLGGRVPMTEIGTPRQDDDDDQPAPAVEATPTSPAGRALVIRDPHFGRNGSLPDLRWEATLTFDGPELHLDATLNELAPDPAFDDNSTTNSFVSQDGRQLDGLRDSNNRYSFVSTARTIVTSYSSACNSPVRDSFGSGSQGSQGSHGPEEATPLANEPDKIQLRPNATDIENRRQSYRTSNIFFESTGQYLTHRQHSSLSAVQEPPNFSLPHAAARRRAASQTAPDAAVHVTATLTAPGRPPRRPRRPPPPTLGFTRPLSIVADSPSPSRLSSSNPMNIYAEVDGDADAEAEADGDAGLGLDSSALPPDSPSIFAGWAVEASKPEYDLSSRASSLQSNRTSFQVSLHASPRKYASMNSLRPADHSLWDEPPPPHVHSPLPSPSPVREPPLSANDIPRSMDPDAAAAAGGPAALESPGLLSPPRSRSPIQRAMAAQKRASMYKLSSSSSLSLAALSGSASASASSPPRRRGSVSVFINNTAHRQTFSDHRDERPSPRRRRGSGSEDLLWVSSGSSSGLGNRRSMPQITMGPQLATLVGPPPAPPPKKALPPIPVGTGAKRQSGSIPAVRMRAPSTAGVAGSGEF